MERMVCARAPAVILLLALLWGWLAGLEGVAAQDCDNHLQAWFPLDSNLRSHGGAAGDQRLMCLGAAQQCSMAPHQFKLGRADNAAVPMLRTSPAITTFLADNGNWTMSMWVLPHPTTTTTQQVLLIGDFQTLSLSPTTQLSLTYRLGFGYQASWLDTSGLLQPFKNYTATGHTALAWRHIIIQVHQNDVIHFYVDEEDAFAVGGVPPPPFYRINRTMLLADGIQMGPFSAQRDAGLVDDVKFFDSACDIGSLESRCRLRGGVIEWHPTILNGGGMLGDMVCTAQQQPVLWMTFDGGAEGNCNNSGTAPAFDCSDYRASLPEYNGVRGAALPSASSAIWTGQVNITDSLWSANFGYSPIEFTLSFWFKATTNNTDQLRMLRFLADSGQSGLAARMLAEDVPGAQFFTQQGSGTVRATSPLANETASAQWHHVALVRHWDVFLEWYYLELYLDGVWQQQNKTTQNVLAQLTGNLFMSGHAQCNFLERTDMLVDEVEFYPWRYHGNLSVCLYLYRGEVVDGKCTDGYRSNLRTMLSNQRPLVYFAVDSEELQFRNFGSAGASLNMVGNCNHSSGALVVRDGGLFVPHIIAVLPAQSDTLTGWYLVVSAYIRAGPAPPAGYRIALISLTDTQVANSGFASGIEVGDGGVFNLTTKPPQRNVVLRSPWPSTVGWHHVMWVIAPYAISDPEAPSPYEFAVFVDGHVASTVNYNGPTVDFSKTSFLNPSTTLFYIGKKLAADSTTAVDAVGWMFDEIKVMTRAPVANPPSRCVEMFGGRWQSPSTSCLMPFTDRFESLVDDSGGGNLEEGDALSIGLVAGLAVAACCLLCIAVLLCIALVVVVRRLRQRDRNGGSAMELPSKHSSKNHEYGSLGGANSSAGGVGVGSGTDYKALPVTVNAEDGAGSHSSMSRKSVVELGDSRWEIDHKELQLGEAVGSGAFGVVYKAKWRNAPVAVKKVKVMSEKQFEEFQTEMQTMMKLRPHLNVVQLLGVVTETQHLAIVTEFVGGGSLLSYLRGPEDMTYAVMLGFIKGIAAGMAHLHRELIVHRDLAARNILLTSSMEAKVSDFGMARMTEEPSDAGKTTTNSGPLKWMAPECILQRAYSQKSDVWSFAVVLVEIVTRNDPYPDHEAVQVAGLVSIGSLRPQLPPELLVRPDFVISSVIETIKRCVLREPDLRPSMNDMFEWVEHLMLEAAAPPPSAGLINLKRSVRNLLKESRSAYIPAPH